jgi:hypothetical protein
LKGFNKYEFLGQRYEKDVKRMCFLSKSCKKSLHSLPENVILCGLPSRCADVFLQTALGYPPEKVNHYCRKG